MNATDVLDAYLDQHCKRSFQTSKNLLRGKPPRHGLRARSGSSSINPSELLPNAAWPLSPTSGPARRSKAAGPAKGDRGSAEVRKHQKMTEKSAPNPNIIKHSTKMQQQTAPQPSASYKQPKEAPEGWQKAEVKLHNRLPASSGEACYYHRMMIGMFCTSHTR